MMPDPYVMASGNTIPKPSQVTARFQLDEGAPRKGDVDGAWWPRSRALVTELPDLLETLAPRLGRIAFVAYHPDDWETDDGDTEPGTIAVGGHNVRLESVSATSDGSDAVAVMAADGQCITLALVPLGSSAAHARAVLTGAARPHPTDPREGNAAAAASATAALGDVVDRLNRHNGHPTEQQHTDIARRVHDTAAQFTHSPIQAYVPILVENLVRNQPAATAAQHPSSGSADH